LVTWFLRPQTTFSESIISFCTNFEDVLLMFLFDLKQMSDKVHADTKARLFSTKNRAKGEL